MNRKVIKGLGIAVIVLALMACSRRPEQTANNSAPVVQISKNNAESSESTTAQSTTAAQETTSDTTRNANNLARKAIAEIEKRKNVVLGENYEIIIQAQTNDSVDVQVRHVENSNTSIYGFFRYHASDKKLEEMDSTTGEFKSVE
jgi:lipoprotein